MPNILPEKQYFRPREVAKIFDVSLSTIYLWIDTGRLEAERIAGTTIRITKESLEKLREAAIN
jgi:excisionase family DNA binding protein